jgi:hypothetical protein
MLHGTADIGYGTLRYSWAWKHIGLVDFIQRHRELDPGAQFLSVYHNWPGFFVVSAIVSDVLGLRPIQIAQAVRFTPTILNLLCLLALPPIFRRFTDDPRLVWTAAWLFLVGNWVGQDYFSPQGTVFFLYLVMLGLCLGPLQRTAAPVRGWVGRIRERFFAFASRGLPAPEAEPAVAGRAAAAAATMAIILAIAASHPLTPVVVITALAALAVIGRLSAGYCLFAVVATGLWLLYFADVFMAQRLPDLIAEFGHTGARMFDKMVDTSVVNTGQQWISLACRGLSAGMAAAALIGGLRRLAAGYVDGPGGVLVLAATPLLAGTSYGGEVLFRVYMFGLPFLAFFAATVFFPSPKSGRSWATRIAATGVGLALVVAFLLANNGRDRQYRFTPDEVAVAEWLYENAPPNTLLVEGARNYPQQFMNYENITYIPLAEESDDSLASILADPAGVLGRWLDDRRWNAAFVIITRSQKNYTDAPNIMPNAGLARIEEALLASPRFKVVRAGPNARVFALLPEVGHMGAWVK